MINRMGTDKILHYLVCFIIAHIAMDAASQTEVGNLLSKVIGFSVAMVIGVLKEVYDRFQPGNRFCLKDLLADALGAASGVMVDFIF